MKSIGILILSIIVAFIHFGVEASVPVKKGWWKFDVPSNLTMAEPDFGETLSLQGKHTAANGPADTNGAVLIGPGSYYKLKHHINANGGGAKVNEYSLQFDFKIPENGVWHCFFQTAMDNRDDGDLFINPAGNIGVAAIGYSDYIIKPDEWYRLVITVKNGTHFNYYLDGKLLLTGTVQSVDGRFSMDSLLLVFADNDLEDAPIYCAELAIWDQALTEGQVEELGGYGHNPAPFMMTRIPYLQGPGQNTMTINWHDTAKTGTQVEYGKDTTLTQLAAGNSEIISSPFRWHTVKLTGLDANARYFYRVASGNGVSGIYSFKTLPINPGNEKIRFVILSDTHADDNTMALKILQSCRDMIKEDYGEDIENHVNGIFHSGDIVVSGNSPGQYTLQYFYPLSVLSPFLPTMVVAGNHEGESPYFYRYLKLDEQSAYPSVPALNEKIWHVRIANTLFIGLNTNIISSYGKTQADWLDKRLKDAEEDSGLDFVFIFLHHPPFSELWYEAIIYDNGAIYVKNVLFPILKKYTKVQQINYGHTHGYERGTIPSDLSGNDFRIVCGGGGGGPLDPWGPSLNFDYNEIHLTVSNYIFQILEIDPGGHSYENSVYSLGTLDNQVNTTCIDSWYRKKSQPGPDTPLALGALFTPDYMELSSSEFAGADSLMTVRLQIIDSTKPGPVILDTLMHWMNVYNVDNNRYPIDRNQGVDLYQTVFPAQRFQVGSVYYRVCYRDHNLKWSPWSDLYNLSLNGINSENESPSGFELGQNYPNPFQQFTTIPYCIPGISDVSIKIYDSCHRMVMEINEGRKYNGDCRLAFNAGDLVNGVYFYQLTAGNYSAVKKMIIIR